MSPRPRGASPGCGKDGCGTISTGYCGAGSASSGGEEGPGRIGCGRRWLGRRPRCRRGSPWLERMYYFGASVSIILRTNFLISLPRLSRSGRLRVLVPSIGLHEPCQIAISIDERGGTSDVRWSDAKYARTRRADFRSCRAGTMRPVIANRLRRRASTKHAHYLIRRRCAARHRNAARKPY